MSLSHTHNFSIVSKTGKVIKMGKMTGQVRKAITWADGANRDSREE